MSEHYRSRVFLALLTLVVLASSVLTFVPKIPPATVGPRVPEVAATPARPVEPSPAVLMPNPVLIPNSAAPAPAQTNPTVAAVKPASPAVGKPEAAPVAGPELASLPTLIHTVKPGESLGAIASRYLRQTEFMMTSELEAAIRRANSTLTGKHLQPGNQIIIPGIEPGPIVERSVPIPKDAEIRAIYLTGWTAGSAHGLDLIRRWKELGGNAVCFDIKDMDGLVGIPFDHPLAPQGGPRLIRSLPKLARFLHKLGMHAIVRIALFRDEQMATHHPELAVQSRRTKEPWRENGKPVWVDPSRREVQDYNIALARHAAGSGIDEVQFDYVRFPAEGDQADTQFVFQSEHPEWPRAKVISDFLERAYAELHPLGVLVSLDVFGVMAWQRSVDLARTGQDILAMARFCDVISPMIYPSHFFGMDGYDKPGDAPEHFIGESMERFRKVTAQTGVVLRPWLQAFAWRTKTYSPEYIRTQARIAAEKGGIGFLFWNARADYRTPFLAMAEIRSTIGKPLSRNPTPPRRGERSPDASPAPAPPAAQVVSPLPAASLSPLKSGAVVVSQ